MKILFIPHPMPAHLIPLLSLAMRLDTNRFKVAFLVPMGFHSIIEKKGFTHLGIDRKIEDKLSPEFKAISSFKPDVLVDDLNYFSRFSSKLFSLPRISVVRKGILPFETYNSDFKHSSEVIEYFKALDKIDFSDFGIDPPKSISDLFLGDINIIPSIPSVESLPKELEHDKSYIYSGPLILSDNDMLGPHFLEEVITSTEQFLERNKTKKVVYVDLGMLQPDIIVEKLEKCFNILFDQPDVVIVTNHLLYKCKNEEEELRLFASSFLPNNLVYSNADLVIHKCGSGSYNYQINNEVPSVILGSNCYDRDEVAIRLEEIGVAKYLSPNLDKDEYHRLFAEYVELMLNDSVSIKNERQKTLASVKEEIQNTQKEFDFEKIIIETIAKVSK